MLSRLLLPEKPAKVPVPGETILLLDMLNSLSFTSEHIRQWMTKDPALSKVKIMVQQGWQHSREPDLTPTRGVKMNCVHDSCLLWGTRVVAPPPGRDKITCKLHEGHPGITHMKALARRHNLCNNHRHWLGGLI